MVIDELTAMFADTDEVIAFNKNVEEDALIVVTQTQIIAIQGASVILGGQYEYAK